MSTVEILCTVYNGERYVAEQLDSIIAQTCGDWQLYIRDDGSTDRTVEILSAYAARDARIRPLVEDRTNRGAKGSFAWLLENVQSGAPYTMFSDADDVWLPGKIERALERIRRIEGQGSTPALVHTDLHVVDGTLQSIHKSFWKYQRVAPQHRALARLLVQNNVTGCTVIINRRLRELAAPVPPGAIMHDWWIALVASSLGVIDYDPAATLLYRQHGRNDTGAKPFSQQMIRQSRNLLLNRAALLHSLRLTQVQAAAFLERYHALLSDEQRRTVEAYATIERQDGFTRRRRLLQHRLLKHGVLRNLAMFLVV